MTAYRRRGPVIKGHIVRVQRVRFEGHRTLQDCVNRPICVETLLTQIKNKDIKTNVILHLFH